MSSSPSTPTPSLRMGKVTLTVHDLDRVTTFYESSVGLHLRSKEKDRAILGTETETLIEIRLDRAARRRSAREAGLFHTAFLLPTRAALGAWIEHALRNRIPLAGASDHLVSEALYLTDPEGNGVEIYADRPADQWKWRDGLVEMDTIQLDVDDLLRHKEPAGWKSAPVGSVVGHVHLQTGALEPAEAFYAGVLGLDVTCRYPGGVFYSADRYHHHLATNIWNSRGADAREYPSTGLAEVEIFLSPERAATAANRAHLPDPKGERLLLSDPWNTKVALVAKMDPA